MVLISSWKRRFRWKIEKSFKFFSVNQIYIVNYQLKNKHCWCAKLCYKTYYSFCIIFHFYFACFHTYIHWSCVGADSFDFFTFTLQWPVTFCQMNQRKVGTTSMIYYVRIFETTILKLIFSLLIIINCKDVIMVTNCLLFLKCNMTAVPDNWIIHGLW